MICGNVVVFSNIRSLLDTNRLIGHFSLGEMLTAGLTTALHAMVMLARCKSDGLRIEAAPAESGFALVPELHHVCMFGASRLNCFNIESAYDHLLDLSSY